MGETNSGTDLVLVGAQEFGADVDALRAAMESTRQQITDSLDDLQTHVEASVDWRTWTQDNPWKAVGYAFALGVYLGIR